ncbi:hypothetical protein BKA81DRAFT_143414 [Phyllosticta paracitricarpa]
MNRKSSNVWSLYVELLCAFLLPTLHPVGMRSSPQTFCRRRQSRGTHTHTHTQVPFRR